MRASLSTICDLVMWLGGFAKSDFDVDGVLVEPLPICQVGSISHKTFGLAGVVISRA